MLSLKSSEEVTFELPVKELCDISPLNGLSGASPGENKSKLVTLDGALMSQTIKPFPPKEFCQQFRKNQKMLDLNAPSSGDITRKTPF
jgi:hypothetical protein